ncbi:MAG: hypothetical protein ACFB6S_08170 [Geminicoccaceae bacterium]
MAIVVRIAVLVAALVLGVATAWWLSGDQGSTENQQDNGGRATAKGQSDSR